MVCGISNDREVGQFENNSRSERKDFYMALITDFNIQVKLSVEEIEQQRLARTEDVQNFLACFLKNENQFSIISQDKEKCSNQLPLIREGTLKLLDCLPDQRHSKEIYAVSILKILSFFSLSLFAFYSTNQEENRKLKQTDQLNMIKLEQIEYNQLENPLINNIQFYLFFIKSAIAETQQKEELTQAKLQRQVELSSDLIKKISYIQLLLEEFIILDQQFLIDQNQDVILDTQLSELISQSVVNYEQYQKQISSQAQYKSLNGLIKTELQNISEQYKFGQDQNSNQFIEMNQDQLKRKAAIKSSSFLFFRINISILLRSQVNLKKKLQIEQNDSPFVSIQSNSKEILNFYDYQFTSDSLQILYQQVCSYQNHLKIIKFRRIESRINLKLCLADFLFLNFNIHSQMKQFKQIYLIQFYRKQFINHALIFVKILENIYDLRSTYKIYNQ